MKEAYSFDLDGVIIARPPIQVGALREFFLRGGAIYEPPENIPEVHRSTSRGLILSPIEAISYYFHSKRQVVPGVREFLRSIHADKFGNTGRPAKGVWVDMTRRTLQAGGIFDQFQEIFFKPPGMRTIISKGAAISELREQYGAGHVTHYDDNPADVLGLARVFPDVRFVVVQDLSTGILFSRVEMRYYPNVTRVARLQAG